jgi:hypothetical protein
MAARPLPDAATWPITIAPGGTVNSNQYLKVNSLDGVSFHNSATFQVNIVFSSLFPPINNLQPNTTSPVLGGVNPLNVTVDYNVFNANSGQQTGGPYAVEFGNGPLTVTISALNTSPDPIAIPAGGEIAFNSDAKYNITWKFANGQPANVWSPQPGQVSQGSNATQTALAGARGQTLTYTITAAAATHGSGTVKVGS